MLEPQHIRGPELITFGLSDNLLFKMFHGKNTKSFMTARTLGKLHIYYLSAAD